jgi:hypothetical protein
VTVPLSDSEQRILEEIEKNLYAEDPAFARGVRRKAPHFASFHRLRFGILSLVIGIGLLVSFLLSQNLIVGVLAFAAMVIGIVLAMRSFSTLAIKGRSRGPRFRDRTTSAVRQWEEKFRNRYKRL